MSFVDEPIQYCIGDSAVTEVGMPLIYRQLTGEKRRSAILPIIEEI